MPIALVYCRGRCYGRGADPPGTTGPHREAVAIVVAINEAVLLETRRAPESPQCMVPYEIRYMKPSLFAIVCQLDESDVENVVRFGRRIGVMLEAPFSIDADPPDRPWLCVLSALEATNQPCLESITIPRSTFYPLQPFANGINVRAYTIDEVCALASIILESATLVEKQGAPRVFQAFLARNVATLDPYSVTSASSDTFSRFMAQIEGVKYDLMHVRMQDRINEATRSLEALQDAVRARFDALAPRSSPTEIASEALSTANAPSPYAHIAAKRNVSLDVKARALQDISKLRQNFADSVWGWREDLPGEPLGWDWDMRAAAGYAADAERAR